MPGFFNGPDDTPGERERKVFVQDIVIISIVTTVALVVLLVHLFSSSSPP